MDVAARLHGDINDELEEVTVCFKLPVVRLGMHEPTHAVSSGCSDTSLPAYCVE